MSSTSVTFCSCDPALQPSCCLDLLSATMASATEHHASPSESGLAVDAISILRQDKGCRMSELADYLLGVPGAEVLPRNRSSIAKDVSLDFGIINSQSEIRIPESASTHQNARTYVLNNFRMRLLCGVPETAHDL